MPVIVSLAFRHLCIASRLRGGLFLLDGRHDGDGGDKVVIVEPLQLDARGGAALRRDGRDALPDDGSLLRDEQQLIGALRL
eukprot:1785175-Pleurochrysis_carterae.AAC.1